VARKLKLKGRIKKWRGGRIKEKCETKSGTNSGKTVRKKGIKKTRIVAWGKFKKINCRGETHSSKSEKREATKRLWERLVHKTHSRVK